MELLQSCTKPSIGSCLKKAWASLSQQAKSLSTRTALAAINITSDNKTLFYTLKNFAQPRKVRDPD